MLGATARGTRSVRRMTGAATAAAVAVGMVSLAPTAQGQDSLSPPHTRTPASTATQATPCPRSPTRPRPPGSRPTSRAAVSATSPSTRWLDAGASGRAAASAICAWSSESPASGFTTPTPAQHSTSQVASST